MSILGISTLKNSEEEYNGEGGDQKIFLSIIFKLKNENGTLVSFKGQSITFRLSIEEV